MMLNRGSFTFLIPIAIALFLAGCGSSVWLPIPTPLLPREAQDTLDRAMAASRDFDFKSLAAVSRNADGTQIDVAEAQYHMGRIRDFLAYDTWDVVWAETRGFQSYWVEVRLTYPDGRTHNSSVSLRLFDDGWKVTGMYPQLVPQPASP